MSGENGEHAQDSGLRATSWGEVVRLRTLPAAVAPVILGAGAAAAMGELSHRPMGGSGARTGEGHGAGRVTAAYPRGLREDRRKP